MITNVYFVQDLDFIKISQRNRRKTKENHRKTINNPRISGSKFLSTYLYSFLVDYGAVLIQSSNQYTNYLSKTASNLFGS